MTSAGDAGSPLPTHASLRPHWAVLAGGTGAIALVSAASLPATFAVASTVLGALMIVGADVDARTFLLPDVVTAGAVLCGVVAAAALDPLDPWVAAGAALARAGATAAVLAALRWFYGRLRGREGLGLGDVKLAAGIGAWLPLEDIPLCFGLAACAALTTVVLARLRGQPIDGSMKVPFGAFLCPALWLVFYGSALPA
jgi:leader peptidase (prepilin peptidase) / N-methyltransferase